MYRAVALWALRLGWPQATCIKLEQLANEASIELLPGEENIGSIEWRGCERRNSRTQSFPGGFADFGDSRGAAALLQMQRDMAKKGSIVMEGRDIGSVVFPEAQVKIFLDAHPEERARRRAIELHGHEGEVESIAKELHKRDHRDRTRAEAPLVQAPDAQLVDTTGLSVDEVEEIVLRLVRARVSNGKAATG